MNKKFPLRTEDKMSDDNSILMKITVPVFIDYADKSAMLSTPNGLASLLSKFHRQLLCMKHYERAFQPDFCSAMPPNCHPFSCLLMQNHLFCRPVWPVTTPNNTMHPSAILRFFRQESISSLIIFACSAYCYTSPAPLILCSTLFISKFTFLQKTFLLQIFYYLSS